MSYLLLNVRIQQVILMKKVSCISIVVLSLTFSITTLLLRFEVNVIPIANCYETISMDINQSLTELSTAASLYFTYTLDLRMNIVIDISPSSSVDYDLYTKWDGSLPTENDYDCASMDGMGVREACAMLNHAPGTYYFMVKYCEGTGTFNVTLTGHPCFPVHNLNTGLNYTMIQEAIDASETLNEHTIFVKAGTYYENIVVNKTISLIGENRNTTIIDGDHRGVIVVEVTAHYVVIADFTIRHGEYGIHLASDNNTITTNIITRNCWGIGAWLGDAVRTDGNVIEENTIIENGCGICMYTSYYNKIIHNNISSGRSDSNGIILYNYSFRNIISKNNFHTDGESFFSQGGEHNIITENNFCAGSIYLTSSYLVGDIFYHNNFLSGGLQTGNSITNFFDNGYPSGGNYWSDYTSLDLYRGPNQNEIGSDGICDEPYIISENSTDHYPLMKPYAGLHDIGMKVSVSKTIVAEGYNATVIINITIINYGGETETFNFTSKINTTIFNQTLTMTARNSSTLAFTWNTTGLPKDNYPISAWAESVSGEIDTADNTFNYTVYVSIPGDVNVDKYVDQMDLYLIALACGTEPSNPSHSTDFDVNCDSWIDMMDLYITALHYGEQYDSYLVST